MNPIKVARKPKKCYKCSKSTVVKILYGMPTDEALELSEQGKLVLGGCCISEISPEWVCTNCETEYKKNNDTSLQNRFIRR